MPSSTTGVQREPLSGASIRLTDEHLRTLLECSHEFNSTLDLDALLPSILDLVLETLNAEAGSMWLAEGESLRCLVSAGHVAGMLVGVDLPTGAGFIGHAAHLREPVLVDDARADERYLPQLDQATGFESGSVMAVPLIVRGELIGVIEVANHRGDGERFDATQLAFLVALADDAAAAVRNARLFDAERKARDLKALLAFSQEVAATFELDRVYPTIVNLAGEAIPFDRCVLGVQRTGTVEVAAISGQESVDRRAAAIRDLERLLTWLSDREEPLQASDAQDPDDAGAAALERRFPRYLSGAQVRSFLALPLRDGEGPLGVLLFESASPAAFGDWRREAAELLAASAVLAMRNAQLYAGVPFISVLEPLARRRKALAGLPRARLIRYGAIAAVALVALAAFRMPVRVSAREAVVRAAVQRPAHAGVSGVLEEVFVAEGTMVEAGAPLARLRDEERLRAIRRVEGELELARQEAGAANARGDAAAAGRARIRIEEAEAALGLLREQESRGLVRAPSAGLVLTPRVEERVGSYVRAGEAIALIGDPAWVEVELHVSHADIGAVREGDRVRVRVPAHPGLTFEGRVVGVAPRAGAVGGEPTYTVRAFLDNERGLLRPGMEARAKVLTRSLPVGAVLLRRPARWAQLNSWWVLPL
ncbi:MAG TPA: GAF domain-containing protein [Longimicrobiales bacterium]|nr:GAF domain-containing protein [Longimicrobiales bacterium]